MKTSLILLFSLFAAFVHAAPNFERKWSFAEKNTKAWNGGSVQGNVMMLNGKSMVYQPLFVPSYAEGRRFVFSADLEGNGEVRLGTILIKHSRGRKGLQGDAIKLQNERKKLEYVLDLAREGNIQLIAPSIRYNGVFKVHSAKITEMPLPNVSAPKAVVEFDISRKGAAIADVEFQGAEENMSIIQISEGKTIDVTTGKNKVAGSEKAHVLYRASAGGNYTDVSRCCFEPQDYDRFQSASSQIKLKKNYSILFLGDSLTDFCRGYNHLAMTTFWINKYNPGKFTAHNAAVHGDFLERIYHRLIGKKGTFKQECYKDLWKDKYDLIFIWIGHNDTVWRQNVSPVKKQARTTPEKQRKLFLKVFQEIRKHSQAQIILVTASPMNSDRCAMNTQKNKLKFQFAIPELVKSWNKGLGKIAAENGMNCIDMYSKLLKDPQFAELTTDGVHFSQYGHRAASYVFLQEIPNILTNAKNKKED